MVLCLLQVLTQLTLSDLMPVSQNLVTLGQTRSGESLGRKSNLLLISGLLNQPAHPAMTKASESYAGPGDRCWLTGVRSDMVRTCVMIDTLP